MLVHITEIIGSRCSGRTTKLTEELVHSIKDRPDKTHVIISTDIKIRDMFNVAEELGVNPVIVTINPLHKNGNIMHNRSVTKMDMEDILMKLKDEYVYVYVDNITLPLTEASLKEVSENTNVVELFYTGIAFHFGKGRALIKSLFNISDYKYVRMTKYKLNKL